MGVRDRALDCGSGGDGSGGDEDDDCGDDDDHITHDRAAPDQSIIK